MSNLCVFTTGTNLDLLRESCLRVMITLHTYDCNPWKGYVTGKLREAIKFLEKRPESYMMWVDGNDSLVLQPEEVILARIKSLGDPILIAAERTCWPSADLAARYRKKSGGLQLGPGPFFINSGGYIGHRDLLLTTMHTVLQHSSDIEDDQLAWTRAYLDDLLPNVQIDHSRLVFSSVGDGPQALTANSCMKHFNGRIPGRDEYWDSLQYVGGQCC